MEGLELRKALEEAGWLVGARLSKVHQVGEVLFLRFFNPPGALVLDAPGKAFHVTALRPPTPREPPPFCRSVRALEGQKLLALEQAGFDRVIRLRFQGGDLILDLRPRTGNVFLFRADSPPHSLHPGEFVAAEFGGRFGSESEPLPVVALTEDSRLLAMVGNDYGTRHIYCRQVATFVRKGDLLVILAESLEP